MALAQARTRDFWFIYGHGATVAYGSPKPLIWVRILVPVLSFYFIKLLICSHEQDHNLLQRKLQRVTRKSNLANLESVATKYHYCTCRYCYHYRNGVGYGLFKQPIAEVDLFIIQVI